MKLGKSRPFVVTILFATLLVFLMEIKGNDVVSSYAQEEYKKQTTETVYVIVDIVNYCYNNDFNGNTYLYCQMPDGSLQVYSITDAPEPNPKCTVACLATEDIENYAAYRVVAVR